MSGAGAISATRGVDGSLSLDDGPARISFGHRLSGGRNERGGNRARRGRRRWPTPLAGTPTGIWRWRSPSAWP